MTICKREAEQQELATTCAKSTNKVSIFNEQTICFKEKHVKTSHKYLYGIIVQRNPEKNMSWRHCELLWLIGHLGIFLSENRADASLTSLRNFFRGQKQNGHWRPFLNYVLANIFASKPFKKLFWCLPPCFQGQGTQ